jgi:hypothetical protein
MPSVRPTLGVTTVPGPDMRRMLGAVSAPDGDEDHERRTCPGAL